MIRIKSEAVLKLIPPGTCLDAYMRYAMSQMDAPAVFQLGMALNVMSGLVPPMTRVWTHHGWGYINNWTLLVGESTTARKTTVVRIGQDLMNAVDPDRDAGVPPGSTEAMIDSLVAKPTQTLFYPEYGQFLQMTSRDHYRGIRLVQTNAYDGVTIGRNTVEGGRVEAPSVRFGFAGGLTPAYLEEWTDTVAETGGFLARSAIWMGARENFLVSAYPDEVKRCTAIEKLRALHGIENIGGCVAYTADALEHWARWTHAVEHAAGKKRNHEGIRASLRRSQEFARKTAVIFSLMLGQFRVGENWPLGLQASQLATEVANLQMLGSTFVLGNMCGSLFRRRRRKLLAFASQGATPVDAMYRHMEESKRDTDNLIHTLEAEGRFRLMGDKQNRRVYLVEDLATVEERSKQDLQDTVAKLKATTTADVNPLSSGAPTRVDADPRICGVPLREFSLQNAEPKVAAVPPTPAERGLTPEPLTPAAVAVRAASAPLQLINPTPLPVGAPAELAAVSRGLGVPSSPLATVEVTQHWDDEPTQG